MFRKLPVKKFTEEELRQKLTPQQYKILREKGTEEPFTGKFLHNKTKGIYTCAVCGTKLFSSEHKFDSGSGWPSFYNVITSDTVKLREDRSLGAPRVEVACAICGSHLGHVFNDAPDQPTGMRFCINSVCLQFQQKEGKDGS
jgi:peptide-methionine (R)-S-oxide reductase